MRTWKEKHPNWEYLLWDEGKIAGLGITSRYAYGNFEQKGEIPGMCDLIRVEILLRYGGVYIDADMECLQPLDNADFMGTDFFATYANRQDKELIGIKGYREGTITNSVIGAIPNHPLLLLYSGRIGQVKKLYPPWQTVGAMLLTQCIEEYGKDKVCILPYYCFSPTSIRGRAYGGGERIYARHYWGATKQLYEKDQKK